MIDYEVMLLSLYTDTVGMRKLINGGLKDENVGILGESAVETWKSAKSWYQKTGKAIPLEILMEDHEQYIRNHQEQGGEEVAVEPGWLVTKLQTRYLHKEFQDRMEVANRDGTFEVELDYKETLKRTKNLAKDLLKITVNSTADRPLEPMSASLPEFVEDTLSWQDRLEAGELKQPVTFGFDLVDNVYRGIRPGELVVMAAYAKIGKSFLLCKQALKAALKGYRVALWTLENSEEETFARLTALAGGFAYDHVSNKTLPPGQRDRFRDLVGNEVFERLYVKQPVGASSSSLEEMYWQSYDAGIELFVGDQLSHVYYPSERKGDPDWLNEGQKLLAARALSRETNMASIWAAQLNQKAANKATLDSTMMARSQGIVQGSDFIFYLSDPSRGMGNVRNLACNTSRRGPNTTWEVIFDYAPMSIEAMRVI